MPVNRNALVRYRTLDNCLRNRFRKWTLEDLIDACSHALYEYEGIDKGVSRRTVQMDIQMMRSDKLGYNAPIVVLEKRYYTYEDPDYSITNIPLTDQDLLKLTEVTEILRQFKGFTHFQDLDSMVNRLEDKIYTAKTHREPIIDFEKNENLRGLEHIDPIYKAIQQKHCILVKYQSFKARRAQEMRFHPFLLKEFRNRWFLLGANHKGKTTMLLALDRITAVSPLKDMSCCQPAFDVQSYFKDVVGVTVNQGDKPENIILFVDRSNAPYVITKPIHPSQKVLESNKFGIVISLHVQLNYELEREILGFGPQMKVLAPDHFKRRMKSLLREAVDTYDSEISGNRLKQSRNRLQKGGYDILPNVFTTRETDKMKHLISRYFNSVNENPGGKKSMSIRQLLQKVPAVQPLIFNANMDMLLAELAPGARLTKAIYFDKPHLSNWYVTWHQDITINVKERIETEGFSGWTSKEGFFAVCPPEEYLHQTLTIRIHLDDSLESNGTLKVIPGTHKKRLSDDDIQLITQNTSPAVCEIPKGGVQFMKPLLLHASSKSKAQRSRRVIHLEFSNAELPEGLEWSEGL
ncbi:MAG TPA: phytanoyl-CoA dioxygenase [Cryomorphaceae bacterium]|nr:phytanoyl-CoA dioxygenase [Owenweeksia sp.]MBF97680.1 phytanoyl-CoA dioxygenase [Owenweeksia sp.]HAD97635.1 phytanoyl-CoA dioxygenase [Cryomorphaceae bacterium]